MTHPTPGHPVTLHILPAGTDPTSITVADLEASIVNGVTEIDLDLTPDDGEEIPAFAPIRAQTLSSYSGTVKFVPVPVKWWQFRKRREQRRAWRAFRATFGEV